LKKILSRIGLSLLFLLILVAVFSPSYMNKAIRYGHVKIDNYIIFENREVKTGTAIPWEHDSLYNANRIDTGSLRQFGQYGTIAFVVVQNNKLLHEQYWDGYSDSSLSNSFSAAKSIISLLIGCLIDERKIRSLDQEITDFLPEFTHNNGNVLRIRDLLTMSSGIEWDEGYSNLFSPTTKAYYGKDLSQQVLSLNVVEEPGKIFTYQSCNTQLLALIVKKASGMTVSAFASEKLWKPLGAEHPAFWSLDRKNGVEKAYCCFNSNATDFARIGQMVLDSGIFNHQQVVSKRYISEAISPATFLRDTEGDSCYYYGYQFWMLTHNRQHVIYARGILGQYIFIIPSLDAVVVRLGTDRSKEHINHAPQDAYMYLDAAFTMLK